ncbi:hypothetical protein SDC49_11510 [Lactobacillus sp. R2/2]|nr:hypothetical protein [Lactobacillus sp. R2/2]
MKNKVLLGSLISALIAFMLYSANLKRVENSSLKIVGEKQEQVVRNKKDKSQFVNPKLLMLNILIILKLPLVVRKNGQKVLPR